MFFVLFNFIIYFLSKSYCSYNSYRVDSDRFDWLTRLSLWRLTLIRLGLRRLGRIRRFTCPSSAKWISDHIMNRLYRERSNLSCGRWRNRIRIRSNRLSLSLLKRHWNRGNLIIVLRATSTAVLFIITIIVIIID